MPSLLKMAFLIQKKSNLIPVRLNMVRPHVLSKSQLSQIRKILNFIHYIQEVGTFAGGKKLNHQKLINTCYVGICRIRLERLSHRWHFDWTKLYIYMLELFKFPYIDTL